MDDTLRRIRHDIRGRLNCLVLSATVLTDVALSADEAVQIIRDMETQADEVIMLLDERDALAERAGLRQPT